MTTQEVSTTDVDVIAKAVEQALIAERTALATKLVRYARQTGESSYIEEAWAHIHPGVPLVDSNGEGIDGVRRIDDDTYEVAGVLRRRPASIVVGNQTFTAVWNSGDHYWLFGDRRRSPAEIIRFLNGHYYGD